MNNIMKSTRSSSSYNLMNTKSVIKKNCGPATLCHHLGLWLGFKRGYDYGLGLKGLWFQGLGLR